MTYEFTTADGRTCCASDDLDHLCDACRTAAATTPPDSYARGRMTAASAHDDPDYQPYGTAPDSYAVAATRRRKEVR